MKLQSLGSGGDKCQRLAANAQEAANRLGLACEVEKITDIGKITGFGVMMTPALVVDGTVVSAGKMLTATEIAKFLAPGSCNGDEAGSDRSARVPASPPAAPSSGCAGGAPPAAPACCGTGKSAACCGGAGKKLPAVLLLVFVAASMAFIVLKKINVRRTVAAAGAPGAAVIASAAPRKDVNTLTVYYFHGTIRCSTCSKIEQLTRQTISSHFGKELTEGTIVFAAINLDEPGNEHFIKDFELNASSVVMQRNGNFERLDAVWTLIDQPEKFMAYIRDGATAMLTSAQ